MKTYTIPDILALSPCQKYRENNAQQLRKLWASRDALTLAEIMALNISVADKCWALSRLDRVLAVRFAWACAWRAKSHATYAANAVTYAYAAATYAANAVTYAYAAATYADEQKFQHQLLIEGAKHI